MSAVCARSSISWPLEIDDSQIRARACKRRFDLLGAHVEVVGVLVFERRADVGPVVAERRRELLLGGDQQLRVGAEQVEQRAEAIDRQQLGDVRPVRLLLQGGDLRQLAVLGGELGRGRDLDLVDVPERALRERREPPQRLDLDVEHVDPHRALLGRGEDVEQTAAQRELPALLDLLDAFVAGRDELRGAFVEVEQLADAQRERVRAQRRVGHLLRERHRADDDHRRLAVASSGRLASPTPCTAPAPPAPAHPAHRRRAWRRAPAAASSASSAATRRPTRCGGGARCDS